jgi:hypothetical protein
MSTFDERVTFYLRHAARIEEWAGLRKEAARAIDEWLKGLTPDLEQLASTLGSDVRLCPYTDPDRDFPGFRLVRPGWPESDAQPGACVAFEWSRKATLMQGDAVPYVGVNCPRSDPLYSRLRGSRQFEEVRVRRKDRPGQQWVAYGGVGLSGDFLGAQDHCRAQLLEAVAGAWRDYAPLIESARGSGGVEP